MIKNIYLRMRNSLGDLAIAAGLIAARSDSHEIGITGNCVQRAREYEGMESMYVLWQTDSESRIRQLAKELVSAHQARYSTRNKNQSGGDRSNLPPTGPYYLYMVTP